MFRLATSFSFWILILPFPICKQCPGEMDTIPIGSWVLEIYICEPGLTLMHIHVFAKQMYKYTLWVSENWYPLRKIYYKCLSVRLGKEKFSCDICFYWHFTEESQHSPARQSCISRCEMFVMPGVKGKEGGGRVASLQPLGMRDWNFRWISLSLSLSLSLS